MDKFYRKGGVLLMVSFILALAIAAAAYIYSIGSKATDHLSRNLAVSSSQEAIFPVSWGDLGRKMVEVGVIDAGKLNSIYADRGGLDDYDKSLLADSAGGDLKINPQNAGFILNIFWALGLSDKNPILENGPMVDSQYGGAGNFASTGGWTLAKGQAMDYYSRYPFININPDQQAVLERVAKNIYRPCCDNPVYFPDCNHGMAMLGFLELLASRGASESQMYSAAAQLNDFWFPQNYQVVDAYLRQGGGSLASLSPQEMLSANYSSYSGYQNILNSINSRPVQNSGSCGV